MRRTDIYLTQEQYELLKEKSYKDSMTLSAVIRDALDKYFSKKDKPVIDTTQTVPTAISGIDIAKQAASIAKAKGIKFTPVPKPAKKGK